MQGWLSKFIHRKRRRFCASLVWTYREITSASVDELWQKVVDLTDVSWHPQLKSTNVPYGLVPKPGLIFQAVTRFSPIPIQIFVERVNPREMLSIRVLAIPGIEERVTYQVNSLWYLFVLFCNPTRMVVALNLVFIPSLCRPCCPVFSRGSRKDGITVCIGKEKIP
jgi:hypothetical protein